jgi:hypothetical protein
LLSMRRLPGTRPNVPTDRKLGPEADRRYPPAGCCGLRSLAAERQDGASIPGRLTCGHLGPRPNFHYVDGRDLGLLVERDLYFRPGRAIWEYLEECSAFGCIRV